MKDRTNRLATSLAVVLLVAGSSYFLLADGRSEVAAVGNPQATASSSEAQNPCNPCRKAQNPCNPCAGKAQNPCAGQSKVYPHAAHYRSWAKLTEPAVSMGHGGKYVVQLVSEGYLVLTF